jgi:hypothetical protein
MKTRLLIIIVGIILVSIGSGTFAYYISVQDQCTSQLGDTHYPRPLTLWNCLDYLRMIQENTEPESLDSFPEKLDTPICQDAISDWLDISDKLDPIPQEILVREELFKQKNDATFTLLNHCDVKSLTIKELQKLRSWEKENEN